LSRAVVIGLETIEKLKRKSGGGFRELVVICGVLERL
jgi:hypothetical protein